MAAERAGTQAPARKTGAARSSQRVHTGARRAVREARSIIGLQRARLLGAAIDVLAQQGYAGLSAAAVCERAGVSRRTFYEVFENCEQCLVAILAEAERRASDVIAGLGLEGLAWGERMRMGLWAILCLVDEDPALGRACVVESQRAAGHVQAERERILTRLVDALDEGRTQGSGASAASRLTAEALVGAISSVIATRLAQTSPGHESDDAGEGVHGLLGELAGMIVLPYQGPAAARRQVKRNPPVAPVLMPSATEGAGGPDPLASLPMRLTYRTARVLQAVAKLTQTGTGASNREIAEHAGISDAGQSSKLLGRLAQRGLLENTATGSRERGEANQWLLTQAGRRVVQRIGPEQSERTGHRSAA